MEEERETKKGTNLLDLPEGCLSHILSLTSPVYVLRSALVCKVFRSLAKSDMVWEKFLPFDYNVVRTSLASSGTHMGSLSRKELVLHLCRSFIRPEGGNMDLVSQAGKLEHATNYIIHLREKIEGLNKRKEQLSMMISEEDLTNKNEEGIDDHEMTRLPLIQFCEIDNYLEVLIVTCLETNFTMSQVIRILQEEGADVVYANFSTIEDKIFHKFHVQAHNSRVGIQTSRVQQRLQELIS